VGIQRSGDVVHDAERAKDPEQVLYAHASVTTLEADQRVA